MIKNNKIIILLVLTILIINYNITTFALNIDIKTKCGGYYNNNEIIAEILANRGYDDIHIAGVIGNWATESTLNPSQLEIGGGHQGHGFMQVSDTAGTYWTAVLRDWNKIKDNPSIQTEWLIENYAPERWEEYKNKSFYSPEEAASYYCKRLEGVSPNTERQIYARQWYEETFKRKEEERKAAEERHKELLRLKTIEEVIKNNQNLTVNIIKEKPNCLYIQIDNNCELFLIEDKDLLDLFILNTKNKNGIIALIEEKEKELK